MPGPLTKLKLIYQSYFPEHYNSEIQDLNSWNLEFEKKYWDNNLSNDNLKELHAKLKYLKYFEFISSYNVNIFDHKIADFGGGPYGGVLPLVFGTKKFLIDLMDVDTEFLAKQNVQAIKSSFSDFIEFSGTLDVIFCLEALDHLSNMLEFERSVSILSSYIKPKGLFFFEMPIRSLPTDGHPISLKVYSRKSLIKIFENHGFTLIHKVSYGPSFGSPNSFLAVFSKND